MSRVENPNLEKFIKNFVVNALEDCNDFVKVYKKGFARRKIEDNVKHVFSNEYSKTNLGYHKSSESSITICSSKKDEPLLTPKDVCNDEYKLTTILHESIHAILTKDEQYCKKHDIVSGSGMFEICKTGESGRGLNEGLTNWICRDAGHYTITYPELTNLVFELELAIGTEKVIKDHSTIGIVVTTDGSIGEIPRNEYLEAEKTIVEELKEIGKPFIVILNSKTPDKFETKELAKKMEEEYNVPVICSSVDTVSKDELNNMLRTALYEFPVVDINVNIPKWIDILPMENDIKMHYLEKIKEAIYKVNKLKDVDTINNVFLESEYISKSYISNFDTSTGNVTITLESSDELYEKVLKESIGNKEITKSSLLNMFISYNENESELKNIKSAIKMAKNTGYGIMHPTIKDMKLSTPEIIKQGSRFGVKLKAQASSVHLIRVDVESTFEPIIGSEMQSKELIDYIMKDYETDKNSIWKSEIFGRSLEQIVKEGIEAKLAMMPETARFKLANTVTKIVNKGANNLIAIVI